MADTKAGIKKILKKAIVALYKLESRVLPMRKDVVLFMSNMGKNYSGNPKAIFEALVRIDSEKKCRPVWAFTALCLSENDRSVLPQNTEIVKYGSFKYYRLLATAGKWVFDTRQEPYLVKRKGCTYIQTWHGTPLKKLGLDIDEMNMSGETEGASRSGETEKTVGQDKLKSYHESFRNEAAKWDYLIAQNDFSAETFKRCFDYRGEILCTGYPRNDVLVRNARTSNPAGEKKILLYAPTWRDDRYLGNGWYGYDSPLDFNKLEKTIGDRCRIILKLHYLVHLKPEDIPKSCIDSGFVTVCGNDEDIADLYLKADGLITDYSSVMFDYSLLNRPLFFYAYDLESYRDRLRGFYFDFVEEAPGPISKTEDELLEDILESGILSEDSDELSEKNDNDAINLEKSRYTKKYREFQKKYNMYDDGQASEKIAQLLTGRKNG